MRKILLSTFSQNAVKIILFLTVTLVGGLLFLSFNQMSFADSNEPRPYVTVDQTKKEATYVSSDGKFQTSYPSDLVIHVNYVHVQGTKEYHPVSNVVELDSPSLKKAPYVLIQYAQNLNVESVRDYVENSSECDDLERLPGEEILVAGVPGLMYKNITCSSRGETRIYFIKGKMEYNITVAGSPVDEVFLNTLLSKFQFLQT